MKYIWLTQGSSKYDGRLKRILGATDYRYIRDVSIDYLSNSLMHAFVEENGNVRNLYVYPLVGWKFDD